MTDWGINDVNDNLDGNNDNLPGPKALRDAYEAMKQKNRTLEDGLAAVQRELATQKVSATLSELGIPATAAEQYKGEADPEKVREWATTMQSIFGGSGAPSPTPQTIASDTPTNTLTPELQAQFQNMNGAGQQGTPLGNAEAAMGRVADANDVQALISAWQNLR